jgi:hypothetical protein
MSILFDFFDISSASCRWRRQIEFMVFMILVPRICMMWRVRAAASIFVLFILACSGCGGRVNLDGSMDSNAAALHPSFDGNSPTAVKVRNFEF